MKINCLVCGHKVELDDSYADYEGQIKCWVCNSLLDIKTKDGKTTAVKVVLADPIPATLKG